MQRGAKLLGFTAMLGMAACNGQPGKLTIRSTGTPLSTEVKAVSSRVADGRSQFALGNVALALESFRKAVREEPGNIDAMTGLAACYDRMGRFDVSRKHYEAALAVEPANPRTLAALATSLDLQGRAEEAAAVRSEIDQRADAARTASSPVRLEQMARLPTDVSEAAAIMRAGDNGQPLSASPTATAMTTAPAQVLPPTTMVPVARPISTPPMPVATAVASALPTAPARSITVTLPPPRPVDAQASTRAVAAAPGTVVPPGSKSGSGPRLERMSMAEVALVTRRAEPMPGTREIKRAARTSTLRFVPLPQAPTRVAVRVLNAARVDRLAATTRSLMQRRGWKNIVIGNAAGVRARSIILYPASVRFAARRLAAQLGFLSAPRAGSGELTVLLGSDAAAVVRKRTAT